MLSYNCTGGTGKQSVEALIKSQKELSAKHRAVLAADNARVSNALQSARALAREAATVETPEDIAKLLAKHFSN